MEEEMLQIRLAKYDELLETIHHEREVSHELRCEIDKLRALVDEWKSTAGVKVLEIMKVITMDKLGDMKDAQMHYAVKGFDDVRELVEKHYGKKIEDLEYTIKRLNKRVREEHDDSLELQCEIAELKTRSLWQRILNR